MQDLHRASDLLTWQDTTSDLFSVCGNTNVCSAAENEVKVIVQRKLQLLTKMTVSVFPVESETVHQGWDTWWILSIRVQPLVSLSTF